jgi:hypothetical protein
MSRIVDVLHVPELGADPASALYAQFQNIIQYFQSEVMYVLQDRIKGTLTVWFQPTYADQINYALTQWANTLQNPYPTLACPGKRGNIDALRKNTAIFLQGPLIYTGCFPLLPKLVGDDGWVGFVFKFQYVSGVSNTTYGL